MVEHPCARCGAPVEIFDEMYEEMQKVAQASASGAALVITHPDGECPIQQGAGLQTPVRRFKVKVEIVEIVEDDDEEPLAGFASTEVEAPSFTIAIPTLTESLASAWERVQEHAAVIDA